MSYTSVELVRSQWDGKSLAVNVAGYRHGPDAGPWTVLASWPLDQRFTQEQTDAEVRLTLEHWADEAERRAKIHSKKADMWDNRGAATSAEHFHGATKALEVFARSLRAEARRSLEEDDS